MAQKNHPTLPQAKGAPGGVNIDGVLLGKHALAQERYATLSTVTPQAHTLNAATGLVRITAVGFPVLVRFNETGGDVVSATNFDDVIPAGSYRDYALDEDVDLLSLLSIGTAADVYVVEY